MYANATQTLTKDPRLTWLAWLYIPKTRKGGQSVNVPLETPTYFIRVRGHLAERWSEWLEGFTIRHDADGNSTLSGTAIDQAALHGLLAKIRDLGLTLLSVESAEVSK